MAFSFHSSHLVYRAIEKNDEDNTFIHTLRDNPESQVMSEYTLLKPLSKDSSAGYATKLRDELLAVIICLPEANTTPDDKSLDTESKDGEIPRHDRDSLPKEERAERPDRPKRRKSSNGPATRDEKRMERMEAALVKMTAQVAALKPPKPISKPIPKPIGLICLSKSGLGQMHNRGTLISIDIIPSEQGKGYGTEAINWALDWSFRIAGLHRVAIGCFSFNEGARRLYERIGFVPEGRKREALWWDGGWHDMIDFSMLEGEWREREIKRKEKERAERGLYKISMRGIR